MREERPPGFRPGDPHSGYYVDLRTKARVADGSPAAVLSEMRRLTAERGSANPVTIVQLALAAWQLGDRWQDTVAAGVEWLVAAMEQDGTVPYLFPLTHTYRLAPPWCSAMAQGEIASMLVRAAKSLEAPELGATAARAAMPLMDRDSGLVLPTPEGPVLQEYPADPAPHVLNGWMSALWGLYDVGSTAEADGGSARCATAFREGAAALARRLPHYRVGLHWSRYDLYPHPVVNVATPFYHRLHVEQLEAMDALAPDPAFARIASEWRLGAASVTSRGIAVSRKLAFRALRPRRPGPLR